MERFMTRHQHRIAGSLTGFDRMLFRGTLRMVSNPRGLERWLAHHRVLLKNFRAFAERLTTGLKAQAEHLAAATGRPLAYLPSSATSKEDYVRAIQARDAIADGLICILACVEPCRAVTVRGDRTTRRLRAVVETRKCLHFYFYFADRDFGVLHVRLQTWLPFTVQVCVNGRDWLCRQLTLRGIAHERADNCVTRVADVAQAQQLLDELTTCRWAPTLRTLAERVNPWVGRHGTVALRRYYWSLQESEFATDVLFHTAADLRAVYPSLTRHAIDAFQCDDVLRFLGRRMGPRSRGEVTSSYLRRPEGLRIKHRVEENSIKMYDKAGTVLRVETTINHPRRFRVFRDRTRQGCRRRGWLPMRKGIADIPRRVELSRAANARYLDALSVVPDPTPVHHLFDPLSHRRVVAGRTYRPLRPIAPDESACFAALLNGGVALDGIRARDLHAALSLTHGTDRLARGRLRGRVARQLRLYRAHGLIAKVAHTHLYRVTPTGHHILSTALRCRTANLATLAA